MDASSTDPVRTPTTAPWTSGAKSWTGHMPATRARLTSILERVVQGDARFTLAERVLVTACEFWALAMAGELHSQTELRAVGKLRFASTVYDAIGAGGVADELRIAHGDLSRLQTRLQRKSRLKLLEARLRVSAEPVDRLLAHLAENLEHDGSVSRERGPGLRGASRRPDALAHGPGPA
jgi:hypothetical protein